MQCIFSYCTGSKNQRDLIFDSGTFHIAAKSSQTGSPTFVMHICCRTNPTFYTFLNTYHLSGVFF